MEKIVGAIREQAWVRVSMVTGAVAILAIALLPETLRLEIAWLAAYWLGLFIPAAAMGAAVGFLAYDKRVWLRTTAGFAVATALLLLWVHTNS